MVQDVLKQCTVEGMVVKLPAEQLSRDIYNDVKKHLELIGGKWKSGKTQGFVFQEDPTELLAAVANGEQRNLKKEFQFFPTPVLVAHEMVDMVPYIEEHFKILEPSAGDGALIKALINGASTMPSGLNIKVDCFELMELNRMKLSKIEGANLIGEDFLQCDLKDAYDIIIANPPFTKNQDIDHIRKMYEVCKPGGIIITLSSPSWMLGSQKKQKEFHQWLTSIGASITEIDAGAFKDSGTMISSLKIIIKKAAEISTGTIVMEEPAANIADNLPEPDEILKNLKSSQKKIHQHLGQLEKMICPGDMNFFKQMFGLIDGIDITMTIKRKNGKLTLSVLPQTAGTISPALITGTPEELDEGFFEALVVPLTEAKGLKVELENFEASIKNVKQGKRTQENTAGKNAAEKTDSKSAKKSAKKKVEKKVAKPEVKKLVPDLFAE